MSPTGENEPMNVKPSIEKKYSSLSWTYAILVIGWILRGVSALALVYSLFLIFQNQYLVYYLGNVSSVALGSVGALYLLSEYAFSKNRGMNKLDAIVYAIFFCAAFLWTYEIIYHFSFPSYSGIVSQLGDNARYLATAGLPVLSLILLRKKLFFTRISAIILTIFVVMWVFWFLYGFPQYYYGALNGGKWLVYSPSIIKDTDPWDTSLFFNFGSKAVLAVFFASILRISYLKGTRNILHGFVR